MMLGGEDNDQLTVTLTEEQEEPASAWIHGEQGDDKIEFAVGEPRGGYNYADLHGGSGSDTIVANMGVIQGDVSISGGSGSDDISVSDAIGDREINGDSGNDVIEVSDEQAVGYDAVYGGDGNDRLIDSSELGSNMSGNSGNDHMEGGIGVMRIEGNPGNDTLVGNQEETTMEGGPDADTFVCSEVGNDIIEDFRPDEDGDRLVNADFCDEVSGP
jgi:serralysin